MRIGRILFIGLLSICLGSVGFLFGQVQHGVGLSWTETNNSDIAAGFNVYRATVAGGAYTKLNTALIPAGTLTYFDSSVVGGTKYFYVVRAVDALGIESANSLEVSATAIAGAPNPPVVSPPTPQ